MSVNKLAPNMETLWCVLSLQSALKAQLHSVIRNNHQG